MLSALSHGSVSMNWNSEVRKMTVDARLRPVRLAHIGIQTYDVDRCRDWYCAVLGAHVVYERPGAFCVVAYDEEHHRIAIVGLPGPPRRKFGSNPEIMHVAFGMADVGSFLENYERLRDLGIKPEVNVLHGVSVSCYYRDPDGNHCELFVDSFPTMEECTAWIHGPVYAHNIGGGVFFDPEELLARWKAGASDEELLRYPVEEGLKVDMERFASGYAKAFMDETERFEAEILAARSKAPA